MWSFRVAIAVLLIGLGLPLRAFAQTEADLTRIQQATVFIMQADVTPSSTVIRCVGSGTIVSRDGLILTNAHHSLPNRNCPGETLIIALNVRSDEPPIPTYRAEIIQADPGLDLALLRITEQTDGRQVNAETLALPFVELADSTSLQLDDTITVAGYPDLGDTAVTLERGTISGFAAEPSGGDKSWIKTSMSIPGTMTGGGAFDRNGRLIGVPTTAPVVGLSPEARCVTFQDTNNDGALNTSDVCVPVGGSINALRPVNFVRPLLRAAALDLTLTTLTTQIETQQVTGEPTFGRLFFSPSVNEAQMPTSVVRSLPTGTDSVYLFFSYENMTPETVYELRVSVNGVPNTTFSLSSVRWSGGASGLWYVGSSGQTWANGVYDFTLFIDGAAAESARLLIGQAATDTPTFSDLIFGIDDFQGAVNNGFVLPSGNTISGRFIYRNMVDGMGWTAIWYFEGEEVIRDSQVWSDGANGTKITRIQDPNGLPPGSYRLELYIDDRLAATADFIIAGAQVGGFARIFTDAHFTTASTETEAIRASAISNFSAGTEAIYALFDWEQVAPGTLWTLRWSVDGDVFYEQTRPWGADTTGENFLMRLSSPSGVPDGTYTMELLIGEIVFAETEARVGIGQLPIDRFAQAGGIQLSGTIYDANTGTGIPGVSFMLISDEYSVADFTEAWRGDQLYAMAITDSSGRFQIDRPLVPGAPYSVFIVAEGYLPIQADGFEVEADTPNLDIPIYLIRG